MSDSTTVARPYAKAIFQYATSVDKLAIWSDILSVLAYAVCDELAHSFLERPGTTTNQISELLLAAAGKVAGEEEAAVVNLIHLLVKNKRLFLLPDIYMQYEALRADYEKTVAVDVVSFTPLTAAQEKKLAQQLQERLQRQVSINVTIDGSILGGAIIRAKDMVIDGSVRGKLQELRRTLTE